MKYFIITFGCQANYADSERIETRLKKMGYEKTLDKKEANLIVLNACSVRKSAVDRIYSQINKLTLRLPSTKLGAGRSGQEAKKKIILAGCILEHDKKNLKDRVDEIWHPDEYFDLMPAYSSEVSAVVPIMTGCNNFCSYCAVPYTRGKERSKPAKEIIKEVENLISRGIKEVWLLGQNVNSYKSQITKSPPADATHQALQAGKLQIKHKAQISKHKRDINFAGLLKRINDIPGKFWIRFTSPHPKDFSDELIKTVAKCEKVTNYINLPVQSGDNEILKKMNRHYTREKYIKLVNKIRKAIPDIAISTDTIVGFPGETKKQFKNSVDLYKKLKFDMAFISEYSPRPGTAAAKTMKDNVSFEEKKERQKILNDILRKTALENNKKLVEKTVEVLVDSFKDGKFYGRTEGNKLVEILRPGSGQVGEFVKVKITEALPWNIKGELTKPKIIVVLGPTASGKSDLAVELARKYNGEVISADSRQVYKGMDIGTGKITKREMKGIKHYLLDVASPKKIFTAIDFKKQAEIAIEEILEKGKMPIICGGTGFYIRALLDNIEIPEVKPDWKLRKELEEKTVDELFEMLKKMNPERARNIDSKNKRRLVRAIEISLNKTDNQTVRQPANQLNVLWLGIKRNEKDSEKIINKRVDKMIKNGLEKEVKNLIKKYGKTQVLKNSIGYQEWLTAKKINPVRDRKLKISDESLRDSISNGIKLHTLQYAKRQMTWFKKYPGEKIYWIKNIKEAEKLTKEFLEKT